jgi:nucleoid DNA-binding protein
MPKNQTKTLKKTVKPKIQVPTNKPTQVELKRAYQLVTKDLFQQLVKMKEGTIYISPKGSLGSFTKTERKVKSGIQPRGVKTKPKIRTYVYYSIHFKPSKSLKEELNQSLERKYR